MKRRNKILIWVTIAILIVIHLPVILTFIIAGPPLPLYSIDNKDINDHEVVIEIFDSNNNSIFKETHYLSPKEEINQPKPFLLRFKWLEGEHLVKITMDGEFTETYETEIYPWLEIVVDILTDPDSGRLVIEIGAVVV